MRPTGIATLKDPTNYVNKIQGKGIVSSEFIETSDPASVTTDPLTTLQANTCHFVEMIAIDYWHAGGTGSVTTANANAIAIALGHGGGVVEVNCGHAKSDHGWGGDGYIQPGCGRFAGAWNRYVAATMGLHNLVWMYAINAGTTHPGRSLTDTYPGVAFVSMTRQGMYSKHWERPPRLPSSGLRLPRVGTQASPCPSSFARSRPYAQHRLLDAVVGTEFRRQWLGVEQDQNASAPLNDGYVYNRGQPPTHCRNPSPSRPEPPLIPSA